MGRDPTGPKFSQDELRKLKNQKVDDDHREKTRKAPEMDVRDDDSFSGNHMLLKFISMTSLFAFVCYKGWSSLMERREE